jgi:hypothetical protein
LFGYARKYNARFECIDVGCNPDNAYNDPSGGICGENGVCHRTTNETDNTTTTAATHCVCSYFSSGPYCEYTSYDSYVIKQYTALMDIFLVSPNYTEFIQALYNNWTLNNFYYDRFFDHQFKQFYELQKMNGMESWNYPTMPEGCDVFGNCVIHGEEGGFRHRKLAAPREDML